jgi:hypothetical protein
MPLAMMEYSDQEISVDRQQERVASAMAGPRFSAALVCLQGMADFA